MEGVGRGRDSFPLVEVVNREQKQVKNLAPLVFGMHIDNGELDNVVRLMRNGFKSHYGSVTDYARELGVAVKGSTTVTPYHMKFGKLPLVLPLGMREKPFDHESLEAVGYISAEESDSPFDGWSLRGGVKKTEDDGGGYRKNFNWMEHDSGRMKFWLDPYIPGLEFLPEKWHGSFDYNSKNLNIRAQVDFSVSSNDMYGDQYKFLFTRKFGKDSKARFEFGNNPSHKPKPVNHGGMTYNVDIGYPISLESVNRAGEKGVRSFKRVSKGDSLVERDVKESPDLFYEDFVAADMFPNYSFSSWGLKDRKSLLNLVTLFEEGNFKGVESLDWVVFR